MFSNPFIKSRFIKLCFGSRFLLIPLYNSAVGVLDTCDQLMFSYRLRFPFKKWCWNRFTHALTLSLVAAYKYFSLVNSDENMDHLKLRRDVTRTLLARRTDRTSMGEPSCALTFFVQEYRINDFAKNYTQGRCVKCQNKTKLRFVKCDKKQHKACSV